MPSLLAISIGPVQEFIAAGRKTRDLWFGSRLLSDIAQAAARELATQARLIFPAGITPGSAVANKLLAETPDGLDPAVLVERARKAAHDELGRHRDAAQEQATRRRGHDLIDWDLLDRQLQDFLEFYAAWAPLGDDYQAARQRVERLLAGRKALRDFGPAPTSAHGGRPKSSLDPSRESVLREVRADDAEGLARLAALRVKRGEHLDGVSLVKRLAADARFASVVRVAIDPFIRRAQCDLGDGALEPLLRLAADLNRGPSGLVERFDASAGSGLEPYVSFPYDTMLFWDNGQREEGATDDERRLADAFLAEARRLGQQLGIGDLPTAYAVLHADGDRMGAALSGLRSIEDHQSFSRALAGFADAAGRIVRERQGTLVYSGGDDVLAFLPVDRCLDCADALRREFVDRVAPAAGGAPISLSAGIVIVHILEPLHAVLDWARAAEKDAKQERNALSVALYTRSGGGKALTVRRAWDTNPVATWKQWTEWHYRDQFPDGAAYELRALEHELRELRKHDGDAVAKLLPIETQRILKRKRAEHGRRALGDDAIEAIEARLRDEADPLDALGATVDGLILARRLADARRIAEGPAHAK